VWKGEEKRGRNCLIALPFGSWLAGKKRVGYGKRHNFSFSPSMSLSQGRKQIPKAEKEKGGKRGGPKRKVPLWSGQARAKMAGPSLAGRVRRH